MGRSKSQQWYHFQPVERAPKELDAPDCFTAEEWGAYYQAEKEAVWNKKSLKSLIYKDMCEDCTLSYQISQITRGRCKPRDGAVTPLYRFATIIGGEPDPVQPRRSRAKPWNDEEE